MPDPTRVLNDDGSRLFRDYVERAKGGSAEAPPVHLLTGEATSAPSGLDVAVEPRAFTSRVEFGRYLADAFGAVERRRISRDAGLWNWLALFYFDQLCPPDGAGRRKVLGAGHYVLEGRFAYNRYYRHLVRFPWFATVLHGERAAILLTAAGKATPGVGQWGELSEQLAGYQDILGSRAAVEVAARLYLDAEGKPVRGAASPSGPGSVRRLSMVLRQLAMTHDLHHAGPEAVLGILPAEFDAFKGIAAPRARRAQGRGQARSGGIGAVLRGIFGGGAKPEASPRS